MLLHGFRCALDSVFTSQSGYFRFPMNDYRKNVLNIKTIWQDRIARCNPSCEYAAIKNIFKI